MASRLAAIMLDLTSALALGAGTAALVLPVILHLGFGADNDAVIRIEEYAGGRFVVLGVLALNDTFWVASLLLPMLLFALGSLLRLSLWRQLRSALPLRRHAETGRRGIWGSERNSGAAT